MKTLLQDKILKKKKIYRLKMWNEEKKKRFVFEVLTRSKKGSKFFLVALVISLSHN